MNEHQWKAVNQVAQRWKIVSFVAGLITIATYLHTWLHYGDWAIGGGYRSSRPGTVQCAESARRNSAEGRQLERAAPPSALRW